MKFGLLNGGDDGENNGVGIVAISQIFEIQDAIFFFRRVEFDLGLTWMTARLVGVRLTAA